jgi:hypothetical protein
MFRYIKINFPTDLLMRELNRLAITSVIDAAGGFQNYPEDYDKELVESRNPLREKLKSDYSLLQSSDF